MSFLIALPDVVADAARDLAALGSTLSTANAAAATPTTTLLAAAEDEVSAAVTVLFSAHGQAYQALSEQVGAFLAPGPMPLPRQPAPLRCPIRCKACNKTC
ncbi:Triacylglycerol lipase [Mycobacterium persicum]|uniref:Triacylglycerol lipase n=1 Tax=Mycobacterium persicum TaxID=1487726 RepID=A0AB38V0J0_9MYCO|nr:hypothetical protein A4G31_26570 [Mycobacterium persicum]ORB49788.1 hypothetical protein BST40_12050 [Mycobacterium persicum]ORB97816.1 hypothetical protein B1T44_28605 [Mycobacterium persicum]ORC04467.1 hypothetical protein B1T48_27740 [Mycobacterium persicum]VAZ75580.1 Triacylglycerol lipase [Mycobacterium persicum]